MPGTHDPTIAYRVHRAALVGVMIMVLIGFGYLLLHWTPALVDWVSSAVHAVRDAFTWELFWS